MDNSNGTGKAADASVKTEPNSPDRPAAVPASYLWDPTIGPIDDTGKPTGAWREPTNEGN